MNNLSLKWKILLSVTLTCVLAVIVTTVVTARSGLATTEETILEDTRALAKVLGEASIGAITFNDSGTVQSSLRAMGIIDRVRNAVIYVDNQPFAWFTADSENNAFTTDMPRQAPAHGITDVGNRVLLTEAIESDGKEIAVISLRVDMSELDRIVLEAVIDAVWLVVIISIIAATLAYFAAEYLRGRGRLDPALAGNGQ